MGDYKNLRAWQLARDLAVLSKSVLTRLPREERYALSDQWRRAVYSVALNIAEGVKDFRRHLDIARASLHEVEAIIELVLALEYVPPEELKKVRATRDECARTVYGLLRTLPNGPKEPGR